MIPRSSSALVKSRVSCRTRLGVDWRPPRPPRPLRLRVLLWFELLPRERLESPPALPASLTTGIQLY
jgi:hypothetical protein